MKHTDAKSSLLVAAMTLLALCSCSDEPFTGNSSDRGDNSIKFSSSIKANSSKSRSLNNSKYESFNAEKINNSDMYLITTVEDGIDATKLASYSDNSQDVKSRGTQVTSNNIGTLYNDRGITLYAYRYKNQDSYSGKKPSDSGFNFSYVADEPDAIVDTYINDEYLTISNSGDSFTLSPRQRRYWTSDQYRLHFFGIFPSPADYTGDNEGDYALRFDNNIPILHYKTQADKVMEQRDILCSYFDCNGTGTADYTASLPLRHIMCGVTVKLDESIKNSFDKIISVNFSNTIVEGDYNLATETWANTKATADGTTYSATASAADSQLSSDNNSMFLVIPQTVGEDNEITIVVQNSETNQTRTITQQLPSSEWPMGKTVAYTISSNKYTTEYILETDLKQLNFSWDGTPAGNENIYPTAAEGANILISDLGNIRVKSYKLITKGDVDGTPDPELIPLGWKASVVDPSVVESYAATSDQATAIVSGTNDSKEFVYDSSKSAYVEAEGSTRYNYKFKVYMTEQGPNKVDSPDAALIKERSVVSFGSSSNYIDLSRYRQEYSANNIISLGNGKYRVDTPNSWLNASNKASRYTSNCYMISYPGYYEIPVVYGNGIYQDACNSQAFMLSTSESTPGQITTLHRFDGDIINSYNTGTNAWITWASSTGQYNTQYPKCNGSTQTSSNKDTSVLWQDVDGMVQVTPWTRKSGEEYYIRFYIPADKIKPGNAVIKVINPSDRVLWCYHIWVSPLADTTKSNNNGGCTFTADSNIHGSMGESTFLKVPLGYVQHDYITYGGAKTQLVITQIENNKSTTAEPVTIDLVQNAHECHPYSCTYYQWGRKDAFPGAYIKETGHMNFDDTYETSFEPVPYWSDDNSEVKYVDCKGSRLQDGITNPLTFYKKHVYSETVKSARFPENKSYFNLWGCTAYDTNYPDPAPGVWKYPTNTHGSSTRKTSYDPCPVGFKVPPIYAFPAMTLDGYNHSATYSPFVRDIQSEETMYKNNINTPFKNHEEFVNAGAFKFYTKKMTAAGQKGGDTFSLFAMGQRHSEVDEINGSRFLSLGSDCMYWACTNWVSDWTGVFNHRAYYVQTSYSNGGSAFTPVTGNTETGLGLPILPYKDPNQPVY